MPKIEACRYTIRELNRQYFHDKPMRLSLSISLLGEPGGNATIVIDRIGSDPIIKPFVELSYESKTSRLVLDHLSQYFISERLQYGDYYSVKADDSYVIQFWTESERENNA